MYKSLKSQIKKLKQAIKEQARVVEGKIPDNPVDWARSINLYLTPQQEHILKCCMEPPYSVLVRSCHSVGKTFLLSLFAIWFYLYYKEDGLVLCTAPTQASLKDSLFKEMRRLLPNSPDWLPKATRLESHSGHAIIGYTVGAGNGEAFQGRHSHHIAVLLDEMMGIDPSLMERVRSMCERNRKGHHFIGVFNPYDISSFCYSEECSGLHTICTLSALEHPNVKTKSTVVKGAIAYQTVKDRVASECRPYEEHEPIHKAFEFDGALYTTDNPMFECQILGVYPTKSISSVWSQQLIEVLNTPKHDDPDFLIQIGCDVARFGDDNTAIAVRRGYQIVHIERHNGWNLKQTSDRLKALAHKFAPKGQEPQQVPICIDAAGLGAGLVDMKGAPPYRYNFIEVNSATKSQYEHDFINVRSELWFNTSDLASDNTIGVHPNVDKKTREELYRDLLTPVFSLDVLNRRVVEPKHLTKKRMGGKSPDLADAFNLAFFTPPRSQYVEKVTGKV